MQTEPDQNEFKLFFFFGTKREHLEWDDRMRALSKEIHNSAGQVVAENSRSTCWDKTEPTWQGNDWLDFFRHKETKVRQYSQKLVYKNSRVVTTKYTEQSGSLWSWVGLLL